MTTSGAALDVERPRAVATPPGWLLLGFLGVAFAVSGVTVTVVVARRTHEAGGAAAAVALGYVGLVVFVAHVAAGIALVRGHRRAAVLALSYATLAVAIAGAELGVGLTAATPAAGTPLRALGYARTAIAVLSIGWALTFGGLAWRWRRAAR